MAVPGETFLTEPDRPETSSPESPTVPFSFSVLFSNSVTQMFIRGGAAAETPEHSFVRGAFAWFTTNGLHAVLIVAVACIGMRVVRLLLKRGFRRLAELTPNNEQRKKIDMLSIIVRRSAGVVIIIITLQKEFGADIGPVLASAGVLPVLCCKAFLEPLKGSRRQHTLIPRPL